MIEIYIMIIVVLFLALVMLLIKQYFLDRRIEEMIAIIKDILDGDKKRQIFTHNEDHLGKLSFEINRLAGLYDSAQRQYKQEQMMKKKLISNLSHDVRTPLVSVIGYLEAIVENRVKEQHREEYINTAYQKSLLLKEQVNQLFEFVQSDANEIELSLEKIDVCEMTRQILIDFLPVVDTAQMEFDIRIPDEEIYSLVDKKSFIRIVENVVKNTLIHAKEGKYLGVFLHKEEGKIFIDIADRGKGISDEHLPYIFERLYKVENVRSRGGGLGLAIAKELSNKMNGDVEVLHSVPGDTVFRIQFHETD